MSFRGFFLFLTVTAMLFYSVVGTTTVFADDGTGTEPTETEPAPAPDEGEQPADSETETEPSAEETVVEEVTVEDVLEQLPEDTTVTVLDSEGEALPLASQEAVDAIESDYDPIWCPAGQNPTPGENGCTQSYSSFDELLTFLEGEDSLDNAAYQQAGTIYIQQGPYLGGESEIDFNDYTFTDFNQHDLTLQGGWDTTWAPDPGDPFDAPEFTTTSFNAPIIIGSSGNPWVGSLTINDIAIDGVNQTGLTVNSESDIFLNNVEVTNSQSGADLDAGGGVEIIDSKFNDNKEGGANVNANGLVYVDNSEFNNNGSKKTNGYGLKIVTNDEVDIFATSASFNEVFGADITTTGDVYIYGGVFSGNVSYSYSCWNKTTPNGGYGLKVVSQGDIEIDYLNEEVVGDGVQANDNYEFGAYLEGVNVKVGYSTFNNNGYGLKVVSHGVEETNDGHVTLQSVNANDNELFGANVSSDLTVTINNSFFDGNKSYTYSCKGKTYNGYGLKVVANDGIYLTDVHASNNNLFGAHLDGESVNIFGGYFNDNGSEAGNTGKGLEIISDTFVTISDLEANNNQLFGAKIQSVDDVTISNGFFNGNQAYAYSCKSKTAAGGYGVQIVTGGPITITNIEASNNNDFGASLTGANVAIASSKADFFNAFNNNKEGLKIASTGNVSLVDIQANNNKKFGADINAAGTVAITDGFFNGNKSYTYSCKGNTSEGYGLNIVSTGAKDISLINIEANNNSQYGAHLEGGYIYISYGTFSNTDGGTDQAKGLEVISSGNQTTSLYQVNANNNKEFGANIESDGYVSISDSVFSGNVSYTAGKCKQKDYEGYGLKVVTTNDIYLFNVTASNNGTFGANLKGVNVSVTDSTFENNIESHGLEIEADTVVLNNVTALNNGVDGTKICAVNEATVTGSTFNDNGRYGLNVGAPVFSESGNVYLNNSSTGLFYNPSCATSNNNGGGYDWNKPNKDWNWGWGWHQYKPKNGHGHGNSYYGGSSHKSCHSYGKKW